MDLTQLTLGDWYTRHFVHLFHTDARPGTIEAYRNTISVWARVTGNPPLQDVDIQTLAEFRAHYANQPATGAKHARHLNHMLSKLGPPGPRNRDALGVLATVPWCKPPKHDHDPKQIPTDAMLATFVERAPIDLALFAVIASTTGARATAIRGLSPEAIDDNGQLVRFPAATDKRRRTRLKPIPHVTLQWLRRHADEMQRWKTTRAAFARRWNLAAKKAGVPTLRPHGLKRWWGAALIRGNASPWAIRYALDHAQRDVTGLHYLQPFDELAALIDSIPLPAIFTTRLRHETQATLPF